MAHLPGMDDSLDAFVRGALDELGASRRFVSGAAVASAAKRLASDAGIDMAARLKSANYKFGDLVRALASRDASVRVQIRQGSDLLVGYSSAESQLATAAPSKKPAKVRKDFYDAFTLLDRAPHYYYSDRDEITAEISDVGVPIPQPTREQSIAIRNDFVADLPPGEIKDQLGAALAEDSALAQFSKIIVASRLSTSWQAFRYQRLVEQITTWATDHSLLIRKEWFDGAQAPSRPRGSPLRDLFGLFTAEELGQVLIPAKLIAEALARRSKL